jgi:hypothetical protein
MKFLIDQMRVFHAFSSKKFSFISRCFAIFGIRLRASISKKLHFLTTFDMRERSLKLVLFSTSVENHAGLFIIFLVQFVYSCIIFSISFLTTLQYLLAVYDWILLF